MIFNSAVKTMYNQLNSVYKQCIIILDFFRDMLLDVGSTNFQNTASALPWLHENPIPNTMTTYHWYDVQMHEEKSSANVPDTKM